jgi:hypothetical protein
MLTRAMSVEVDEPRRRLVLADRFPVVPKGVVAVVGTVALLLVSPPMIKSAIALARTGASTDTLVDLAVGSLFPLLVLVLSTSTVRGQRFLGRLVVDRGAGRIEATERRYLGGGWAAPETIPLVELRGLNMRTLRTPSPAARATSFGWSPAFTVTLKLVFREDIGRQPRQLSFAVEGLDRNEEAVDLGMRLASAAGFDGQRLVRNDLQGTEMEFGSAPDLVPLAGQVVKADYVQDRVQEAAQALAAHEQTPRFDPASFKGDHVVDSWQPGVEVRFRRSMRPAAIGCAPGVLLLFWGPWVFFSPRGDPWTGLADRLFTSAFFGLAGLLVGVFASVIVWSSCKRTVAFDWGERRLRLKTLFFEQAHDFSTLSTLELQRVRIQRYDDYFSELYVHVALPAARPKRIELLSTARFRDDPDTPYGIGLSLLNDLAQSVGVKQLVTDDSRRS